jgi:hypothetical protein
LAEALPGSYAGKNTVIFIAPIPYPAAEKRFPE